MGVSSSQPNLVVSLTNILGEPVKQVQFSVSAESGKSQKANGGNLVASKKAFTSKSSDGTTHEIKLVESQPAAGFYTVVVSATPKTADKRFFLVVNSVEVKVTTQATITDLEIGVADRDQAAPKLTK